MSAMFAVQGDSFVPLETARGYWSHNSMHGRAIIGILGQVLDVRHGGAELLPARLTVDMHRLAPFRPLTIETRVLRDGGRLRLAEAAMVIDGTEYARASCQFLRPGVSPDKPRWSGGRWDAPHPDTLPSLPPGKGVNIFEWKNVAGRMGSPLPRQMWMRELHDLIEDVPLSPWARLVAGADFASPWAHGVPYDPGYINTDLTVQIHRLPEGEWIGYETIGHEASSGIAVGQCRLHDVTGPIGFASATALHNPRSTPKN